MRFDLSVNVLTASALFKNRITIFGGSQLRPNLHILDYIRMVKLLLVSDECVGEIFNVGDQNLSILEIGNSKDSPRPWPSRAAWSRPEARTRHCVCLWPTRS